MKKYVLVLFLILLSAMSVFAQRVGETWNIDHNKGYDPNMTQEKFWNMREHFQDQYLGQIFLFIENIGIDMYPNLNEDWNINFISYKRTLSIADGLVAHLRGLSKLNIKDPNPSEIEGLMGTIEYYINDRLDRVLNLQKVCKEVVDYYNNEYTK